MNEKSIRDELDALRGTEHELEGFERTDVKVSKTRRDVFSLRISPVEMALIEAAAATLGQNIGEFIRTAALNQARTVTTGTPVIMDMNIAMQTLLDGWATLGLYKTTPLDAHGGGLVINHGMKFVVNDPQRVYQGNADTVVDAESESSRRQISR